jgi:uncharacterized LabA/DUF88 family protein
MHGRIALVIDGPNLSATARVLGFEIDYRRLLDEFQSNAILLRAVYFAQSSKIGSSYRFGP